MKSILRSLALRVALLCAVASLLYYAAVTAADAAPDSIRRAAASTVMVYIQYGEPYEKNVSWGTGFVIGDGLVMTNAHVVSEKVPTRIFLKNDSLPPTEAKVLAARYETNEFMNADIVEHIASTLIESAVINGVSLSKSFSNYDVALLSFTPPPGVRLPALSFALDATPGQPAFAIGYPGADRPALTVMDANALPPPPSAPLSITRGAVNELINREPLMIMHDAYAKSGNSGGPLVNARGEVLGMQTWSAPADNQGVVTSFALGSRDLAAFVRKAGYQPAVGGRGVARLPNPAGSDVSDYVAGRANAGNPDFLALAGLLTYLGDCGFDRDPVEAANILAHAVNIAPNSSRSYLYRAGLAAVLIRSPELRNQYRPEDLLRQANNSAVVNQNTRHPDYKLLAYEAGLYMQGSDAGFPYDPGRAMQLAQKAMEGDFALPMALVGYEYYFGDSPAGRDHKQALLLAREAARNGIPEGISLLAHLYYDSDAVPRSAANVQFAKTLATEAVRLNDPWALGLLSIINYESGNPREREQAQDLAMRGARHGNRLALYCLGRIAWDDYLANPGDMAQAAKAWAFIDLAERRGVRIDLPAGANLTHGLRSSRDILGAFAPDKQQWLMAEGQRAQEAITA